MRRGLQAVAALVIVPIFAVSTAPSSWAVAATDDAANASSAGSGATEYRDSTTTTVVTDADQAVPKPASLPESASPAAIAKTYLLESSTDATDPNTSNLNVTTVRPSVAGGTTVRLQETINGVPVLGAEKVVDLNANGDIRFASDKSLTDQAPRTSPTVSAATAKNVAVMAVAKSAHVAAATLTVSKPALWIYDTELVGGQGATSPSLVWRMTVSGNRTVSVKHNVLVSASDGKIVRDLNALESALNREVCDAGNTSSEWPCTSPVRVEGGPASSIPDVNDAYTYAGDTYNFYASRFGRDSLDGHGLTLTSTTRYCDSGSSCPFVNAFWDGSQMVYGEGLAVDDVVGHELTHGVTGYLSNLDYWMESGSINESLSDAFGEFIDQTNATGSNWASDRWKLGEDVAGYGPFRNMADPTQFGDPDRMGSPNYYHGWSDNGGVHTNSGVGNKLVYLMTDGGKFNGQTITGLGLTKAPLVVYGAAQRLVSSSQYVDYGLALRASCAAQVGSAGITTTDCDQVERALAAVEITVPPSTTSSASSAKPGKVGAIKVAKKGSTRKITWGGASAASSYRVKVTLKRGKHSASTTAYVSGRKITVSAKRSGKYTVSIAGRNSAGTGASRSVSFRVK